MDWSASVDIYCERMGPEFWAEPLNAISNAAFILAALWAAWSIRAFGIHSRPIMLLTALAFCIGVGSFLFHTYAQIWSGLADTIPIWTFVLVYILTCIHVIGGVAPGRIAIGTLVVFAVIIVATLAFDSPDSTPDSTRSWTNGSEQYLPAVAAMLFFSALTLYRRHPLRVWFTAATAVFLVSLGFRTLDIHVCDTFPAGTHFIWHTLNGAMIALLLQALIRHRAAESLNP